MTAADLISALATGTYWDITATREKLRERFFGF
jgi:hypothetical protein